MRKTPVRHSVRAYTKEDGTYVKQHVKGRGFPKVVTYREGSIIPEYLEEDMKKVDIKTKITQLKNILNMGRITTDLRETIKETIKALRENNIPLASELTSVKSLVTGTLDTSYGPYGEDRRYNGNILGQDVYSTLDSMHFDLAMKAGEMPSGAIILTSGGIGGPVSKRVRPQPKLTNPQIKKMEEEREKIRKGAGF